MTRNKGKKKALFGGELSPELRQNKLLLLDKLGNFFHSPAFSASHHWANPPFHYVDVKEELEDAADIATRIRAHCVAKHPDMRTHPVEGAAIDFLWSVHEKPSDRDKFVQDLVAAIFSNAQGFEAPLDETLVARYVAQIRELRQQYKMRKPIHHLKNEWAATELLLDEVVHGGLEVEEAEGLREVLHDFNVRLQAISQRIKETAEKNAAAAEAEAKRQREAEEAAAAAQKEAATAAAAAEAAQKEKEAAAAAAAAESAASAAVADDAEEDDDDDDEESSNSSDERRRMKASIDRSNADTDKRKITLEKIASKTDEIARDVKSFEDVDLARLQDAELSDAERNGLISRLHKRSLQYAQLLEAELLQLDNLTGDSTVRAQRKMQVAKIQEALRHVDGLQKKLKELHVNHHEQKRQSEEETTPENAAQGPPQAAAAAAAAASPPSTPPPEVPPTPASPVKTPPPDAEPLLERMRAQKLKVQFQVKDTVRAFIISAYVPGMDQRDLRIGLDDAGELLTCSGVRMPSQVELRQLASHPQLARLRPGDRHEAMMQLSRGRFGTFEEKWRLDPGTVKANEIEASYERGVIEIVVPKRQQQQQKQQRRQPSFPGYSGYSGYPGGFW